MNTYAIATANVRPNPSLIFPAAGLAAQLIATALDRTLPNLRSPAGNAICSGPAIRERVRERTRELARLAGRAPAQVSQVDYEQAKREVTGESDPDRQDVVLTERTEP
jgi:hypothetical protein